MLAQGGTPRGVLCSRVLLKANAVKAREISALDRIQAVAALFARIGRQRGPILQIPRCFHHESSGWGCGECDVNVAICDRDLRQGPSGMDLYIDTAGGPAVERVGGFVSDGVSTRDSLGDTDAVEPVIRRTNHSFLRNARAIRTSTARKLRQFCLERGSFEGCEC